MLTARRRLAAALALCLGAGAAIWAGDKSASSATELPRPALESTWEAPIDQPRVLEAVAASLEPDLYQADVPLDRELQAALRENCEEHGVPVALALGLIEMESGFDPEIVSPKGAYGLFQLNPKYFPDNLSPGENIAAGVAWLGELLEAYGDPAAALRAYNLGYDDGDRIFADAVLIAAERWEAVW